jgi:colicin import membrane protein
MVLAIVFISLQAYKSTAMANNSYEKSNNRIEINVSDELIKIKQEKLSIEENLKQQQAACYKNFAVSSCLKNAKIEAQTALNAVKSREMAINEMQRTAKIDSNQSKKEKAAVKNTESNRGGEEASKVKIKASKAIKTAKPEKVIKTDADILAEKNAAEQSRADTAQKRLADVNDKQIAAQKKAQIRANKNSESAANSAKYNQKLLQAQAHKDELENANLAKKKPKSAPLPTPDLLPNLMPNITPPTTRITTTP